MFKHILLLLLLASAQAQAQVGPAETRLVLQPDQGKVELRSTMYIATDGERLPVDLYLDPARADRRPVLIFLSGNDDPREWGLFRDFGRLAAQRGFVGAVPAKRIRGGLHGIERGKRDVRALLDQLQGLAPGMIDSQRVCLWVFSGGGSLLSLSLDAKSEVRIRCAIGFYPSLTVAGDATDAWRQQYSPTEIVAAEGISLSPHMLIVRAGKDRPVINDSVAIFTERAIRQNLALTLLNLPEAQHAFDLHDDTDWSRAAIEDAFDFATRALRTGTE